MNDLQVERAAHDDTAEKLVELQQRLEVRGPGGGRARRRPFLPHPRPCALARGR